MPVIPSQNWRTRPEVKHVSSKAISIEEAERELARFLESENASGLLNEEAVPDAGSAGVQVDVKLRQLPGILEWIRKDWLGRTGPDRPSDCFVEVQGRLEVHLHPCFLGERLGEGLRRHANEILLRYDPTLKCMPFAYFDLKPAGSHGALVGESPWVHFLADFKAVGLRLAKGQRLLVRPTPLLDMKKGINLLLLGFINCFVPQSSGNIPLELHFDAAAGGWLDDKDSRLCEEPSPIWCTLSAAVPSVNDSYHLKGTMEWPPAKPLTKAKRKNGAAADAEAEATVSPKEKKRKSLASAPVEAEAVASPRKSKKKS
eukprot:TRINITY_DN11801_c0_g2_i1.p1 TRINITY_DN11801_c0_g2~~TRINITY_DN11801_c0_g2_i1.p1  ORF type:complete len:332 (-),score=76.79 TRINITY_DN11801_c0_g2_i1:61-1005(-)